MQILIFIVGYINVLKSILFLSLLIQRESVQKMFQRDNDLGVGIPGFMTLLPVVTYISTFLAAIVSRNVVHTQTSTFVAAIMDIRPPIFNVYECFICGCQVSINSSDE